MLADQHGRPRLPELESSIKGQIDLLTCRQIQRLDVEVTANQVVVRGHAFCYYHKQLALRAILDLIGNLNGTRIDLQIDVSNRSVNPAGNHAISQSQGSPS